MRTRLTLVILLLLTVPAFAADKPQLKLAELAKQYRAFQLPLPPKEPKLFRCTTVDRYFLGFGDDFDQSGRPRALFIETRRQTVDPDDELESVPTDGESSELRPYREDLFTAIQFELCGWHVLAEAVDHDERVTKDPESFLRWMAWNYWLDRLTDPSVERATIHKVLTVVVASRPDEFRPEHYSLLNDLSDSMVPSRAEAGSDDALFDALLDVTIRCRADFKVYDDPRYQAIVRRGFDILPTLFSHLNDNRLTRARCVFDSGDLSDARVYRVRDFAHNILQGYMFDRAFFDLPMTGDDRQAIHEWWLEIQRVGEEAYLLDNAIPADPQYEIPNCHVIYVIASKYPKHLPKVFNEVLAGRPLLCFEPLLEAVAMCDLPLETKRALYCSLLGSSDDQRRHLARRYLHQLEPGEYHKRLLAEIDRLTGSGSDSEVRAFVDDLRPATESKVWEAAEKLLRSTQAGVRIHSIDRLAQEFEDEGNRPNRANRVRFIARFLDDGEVHRPSWWEPFFADSELPLVLRPIEVRKHAALALNELLELGQNPNGWTEKDWSTFFATVATAAKMYRDAR